MPYDRTRGDSVNDNYYKIIIATVTGMNNYDSNLISLFMLVENTGTPLEHEENMFRVLNYLRVKDCSVVEGIV